MAKPDSNFATKEPAQPARPIGDAAKTVDEPTEFPVTIDQFCAELSKTDRRVEMIGGFHYTETAAGRRKDTAAAYSTRFHEFTTKAA